MPQRSSGHSWKVILLFLPLTTVIGPVDSFRLWPANKRVRMPPTTKVSLVQHGTPCCRKKRRSGIPGVLTNKRDRR